MTSDIVLQIVTSILCFFSVFFAIFLMFVESKNRTGNRILAVFLMVRALDASVLIYGNYIKLHPALDVLRHDAGGFLQSPLLFLFILSVIYKDFKLTYKHLLLLLPFLIVTIITLPRYYFEYLGYSTTIFDDLPLGFEISFAYTIAVLQNLGLILLTFFILYRYKKLISQNYAITDNYNYRWLFYTNSISLFLFCAALVKNIHKFQETPVLIVELRILVMSISLIFVCWLVFKALLAPKLFRGIDSNLQLVSNATVMKTTEEIKDNKRTLATIDKLQSFMEEQEPYLDSEITIAKLANQLDMNVTELSLLINHRLSKNFHTFINHYRINKSQELLKSASNKYTIQEILYKVGFNSKSSFNVSFKEQTGLTPTQYKSKHK